MSTRARVQQRMASIALRSIAPEHVEKSLVHYALKAQVAIDEGRIDGKAFDTAPWSEHDAAIASIARDNPQLARAPDPPRAPLPTIKHPGNYSAQINAAKKAK